LKKAAVTNEQKMTEADKAQWRGQVIAKLRMFKSQARDSILTFPKSLHALQRLIVHEEAAKLGLIHTSTGEGRDRHIEVFRSDAPDEEAAVDTLSSTSEEEKLITSEFMEDTRTRLKSFKDAEDEKVLHFEITLTNEQRKCVHVLAEEMGGLIHTSVGKKSKRHVVVQKAKPQRAEPKPKPKPKRTSPPKPAKQSTPWKRKEKKKKKQKSVTCDDGLDELDALLKSEGMDPESRLDCPFPGCKGRTTLINRSCRFYHKKFCIQHGNPVFHDPDRKYCAIQYGLLKRGQLRDKLMGTEKRKIKDYEKKMLEYKLEKRKKEVKRKTKKVTKKAGKRK